MADTTPTPTFEDQVLSGVTALRTEQTQIKTKQETLLSDVDRLSKETKCALEDFTKIKNTLNDHASALAALRKVELQIQREKRLNYADPIERFCADEEKRNWLNAVARRLAFPQSKLPEHLEKALTGVDSGLGQATVPQEWLSEIYSLLLEYGDFSSLQVRDMGARTDTIPIMTARPAPYWIGAGTGGSAEGTAITEGAFTGSSVNLLIQTLAVLLYVSRELIQDTVADISSLVLREMAESIAYGCDFMCFVADGGADQTDAGYHGIFNTAVVHTGCIAEATAGNITVGTTELEDWVRCLTTVSTAVLKRTAKWWMQPQILAKVCLIRDAHGRPIFQSLLEAPAGGRIGSILGYPVVPVNVAPFTDAASAKIAVFGDPNAYVMGRRQQMELATSEHIKFAENQIGYRALCRCGGKHRIPTGNPAGHKPFAVLTLPPA